MEPRTDPLARLPRGIAKRVRAAQRDLLTVGNRLLLGKSPKPLVPRPVRTEAKVLRLQHKAPKLTREVSVVDVVCETPDAVSIYLTELDGSPIAFRAGQFLSVDVMVDGRTYRRAYSLAGPCVPNAPRHITVKRIADGVVSHHLNETIRAGDRLSVLGPSGNFTVEALPNRERHLVMLAGGSGITPIMSLLETVLREEPKSRVSLIYGNRATNDIIFRERLEELRGEFEDRLIVDHVLQVPPADWQGGVGLLSEDVLAERLDALGLAPEAISQFFICGPTPMMDAAHAALERLGVDRTRIAEERFTHPEDRHAAQGSDRVERVVVNIGENAHAVEVAPGTTILEAALAAGLDMPFSCVMGGCGACRVRLDDGAVAMEEPNCLSASERDLGYVLTCVGRPLTRCSVEVGAS